MRQPKIPTRYLEYTYQIKWSAKDNEYIGTCLEFPSLSWLNTSSVETLIGIMQTVKEVLDNWHEEEPPPAPRP